MSYRSRTQEAAGNDLRLVMFGVVVSVQEMYCALWRVILVNHQAMARGILDDDIIRAVFLSKSSRWKSAGTVWREPFSRAPFCAFPLAFIGRRCGGWSYSTSSRP